MVQKENIAELHFVALTTEDLIANSKGPEMVMNQNRAIELLEAAKNLLEKQENSKYVLNMLEETVFYDDTECDGSCLLQDISDYLESVNADKHNES